MCLQVTVKVESLGKAGNFIGWIFIDGANLSEMLLDRGLSRLHFSAEKSSYYNELAAAENRAKKTRINVSLISCCCF